MKQGRLLRDIHRRLSRHYGPLHWWPGESPFEVMVGAILTQNTAWTNVEKAIANLKKKNLLDPHKLYRLKPAALARLIKPAGFFRLKAKRLRHFLEFFLEECGGDVAKLKRRPADLLRRKLLAVNGIGPETADSILLYALAKPVFVIDAYTKRILSRHYLAKKEATYHELQDLFLKRLKPDVSLFNAYHAEIVHTAKDFCRTKPRCVACPLNGLNWK